MDELDWEDDWFDRRHAQHDLLGPPTDVPTKRSKRAVFRSWHGEASLYREMYARTVSALAAAAVITVVAVLGGALDSIYLLYAGILVVNAVAGAYATHDLVLVTRVWRGRSRLDRQLATALAVRCFLYGLILLALINGYMLLATNA